MCVVIACLLAYFILTIHGVTEASVGKTCASHQTQAGHWTVKSSALTSPVSGAGRQPHPVACVWASVTCVFTDTIYSYIHILYHCCVCVYLSVVTIVMGVVGAGGQSIHLRNFLDPSRQGGARVGGAQWIPNSRSPDTET